MKKIKYYVLPLVSLIFILVNLNKLEGMENKLQDRESNEKVGRTVTTSMLKGIGLKRVGADFYFINQVLEVGSNNPDDNKIMKNLGENSEKISYLNPYLISNYNLSGSTLGFINIFKNIPKAEEIFKRGIKYNPNNNTLKRYYAGLLASENNNLKGAYENLKIVTAKGNDPFLVKIVAGLSEKSYYENPTKQGFLECLYFWQKLVLMTTNKQEQEKIIEHYKKLLEKEGDKYELNDDTTTTDSRDSANNS